MRYLLPPAQFISNSVDLNWLLFFLSCSSLDYNNSFILTHNQTEWSKPTHKAHTVRIKIENHPTMVVFLPSLFNDPIISHGPFQCCHFSAYRQLCFKVVIELSLLSLKITMKSFEYQLSYYLDILYFMARHIGKVQ